MWNILSHSSVDVACFFSPSDRRETGSQLVGTINTCINHLNLLDNWLTSRIRGILFYLLCSLSNGDWLLLVNKARHLVWLGHLIAFYHRTKHLSIAGSYLLSESTAWSRLDFAKTQMCSLNWFYLCYVLQLCSVSCSRCHILKYASTFFFTVQ